MSDPTVATRPLDDEIVALVRSRAHGRGYTDLHPRLDLVRMIKATTTIEPTPRAVKTALRRLAEEGRLLVEARAGGVRRLRPLDGSTCPVCGSGLR